MYINLLILSTSEECYAGAKTQIFIADGTVFAINPECPECYLCKCKAPLSNDPTYDKPKW